MEYYFRLDVSLRSCALRIVDNKGTVYVKLDLPCEVEDIANCTMAVCHNSTLAFFAWTSYETWPPNYAARFDWSLSKKS